jgi:hypothetical protein
MATHTWKAVSLDAQPSHEGHSNVINTVHWTLSGTDGNIQHHLMVLLV